MKTDIPPSSPCDLVRDGLLYTTLTADDCAHIALALYLHKTPTSLAKRFQVSAISVAFNYYATVENKPETLTKIDSLMPEEYMKLSLELYEQGQINLANLFYVQAIILSPPNIQDDIVAKMEQLASKDRCDKS